MSDTQRFCAHCGAKMKMRMEPADGFHDRDLYRLIGPLAPRGRRFDKRTGQRLLVRAYTCPNWREPSWWRALVGRDGAHDRYFTGDYVREVRMVFVCPAMRMR